VATKMRDFIRDGYYKPCAFPLSSALYGALY